jgi:hypothetical protein
VNWCKHRSNGIRDLLIFNLVGVKKLLSPLFLIPSESGGDRTQDTSDIRHLQAIAIRVGVV